MAASLSLIHVVSGYLFALVSQHQAILGPFVVLVSCWAFAKPVAGALAVTLSHSQPVAGKVFVAHLLTLIGLHDKLWKSDGLKLKLLDCSAAASIALALLMRAIIAF